MHKTERENTALDSTCPFYGHCQFVNAVKNNPGRMAKYVGLRKYCRQGAYSDCVRHKAYVDGAVPADDLLPNGVIEAELTGKNRHVMVVDDLPVFCKLMEGIIMSCVDGVEVVSASSGTQALEILSHGGIDLVVSDYHMPVMDGGELIERMRLHAAARDVPVIIFSTETDPGKKERCLGHERVRWIAKSPDRERFSAAVRELLFEGRA